MSNQVIEQIDIKEILHEEISFLDNFYKQKNETLKPLIEKAAKKLEPYFEDHTLICAALVKGLPKIADRDIRLYCPVEYKRAYSQSEPEHFKSIVFDALDYLIDGSYALITVADTIRMNLRNIEDETEFRKEEQRVISIFGDIAEVKKFIEFVRDYYIQCEKMKRDLDQRKVIDDFKKFLLRFQAFFESNNTIEKFHNISSKWVKIGIEDNDDLDRLARMLFKTTDKLKEVGEWFKEMKIREECGIECIYIEEWKAQKRVVT